MTRKCFKKLKNVAGIKKREKSVTYISVGSVTSTSILNVKENSENRWSFSDGAVHRRTHLLTSDGPVIMSSLPFPFLPPLPFSSLSSCFSLSSFPFSASFPFTEIQLSVLGERSELPSGSRHSSAPKRFLLQFSYKLCISTAWIN